MNSPSSFFRQFLANPFETLDNLNLRYYGFQLNLLRSDEKLRKAIFEIFFVIPLLAWVLLGPDSTVDQVTSVILNIPPLLLGQINIAWLLNRYQYWYGLGTHWSASVIYSGLLLGTSKHLSEKLNIKNSLNLALTCGVVGLAIASFEFSWQGMYYIFQNQHWIFSLGWPQVRIIIQDALFGLVGLIVLAGLNYEKYKLNFEKKTFIFFVLTVAFTALWITYGLWFPTQQIAVNIDGWGLWTSSKLFPQTMYTVPTKAWVPLGDLFYVPNDAIHLVNNLTKIFWTLTFYQVFKLKRKLS